MLILFIILTFIFNCYFLETMTFPTLGLSCFVYLLLVEEMELMNFPAVFR